MRTLTRTVAKAIAAGGVALPLLAGAQPAASFIDISVANVRNDRGRVRAALCTEPEFLKEHCSWAASAPAEAGRVTLRIGGMPPGIYAVQAFHDENEDGRIDRGVFGLPREGIGFSNDAPMRFGPPRFSDAAIRLGPGGGAVAIRLRYF